MFWLTPSLPLINHRYIPTFLPFPNLFPFLSSILPNFCCPYYLLMLGHPVAFGNSRSHTKATKGQQRSPTPRVCSVIPAPLQCNSEQWWFAWSCANSCLNSQWQWSYHVEKTLLCSILPWSLAFTIFYPLLHDGWLQGFTWWECKMQIFNLCLNRPETYSLYVSLLFH